MKWVEVDLERIILDMAIKLSLKALIRFLSKSYLWEGKLKCGEASSGGSRSMAQTYHVLGLSTYLVFSAVDGCGKEKETEE